MRSIKSRKNILESSSGQATKTILYILNMVPNKSIPKTHFELWTGRKPSLNYSRVWRCHAEVRIYNPFEKEKLNLGVLVAIS